jgi:RNA polymerase sigma-70 factor (sigma-E family)
MVMVSGEDGDFRSFVEAQWQPLLRTAYLLTGDRGLAEDLVQSTLLQVHRRWARIERLDAPAAYARRVLVNLNSSSWRRRRVREVLHLAMPDPADVHDASAAVDLRDQLWRACLGLPPRRRAVVVLRYFEDLPDEEVARVLGISVSTVKTQAHRALATLRAELEAPSRNGDTASGPGMALLPSSGTTNRSQA